MAERLVDVYRGDMVESIHHGSIVVVDSHGRIIHELGNPERITYFRSAAKPIIAISSLEAGIVEKFGLDFIEVAIIASSHTGERMHVDVLKKLMKKTGVSEEELKCGVQVPSNQEAARELYASGRKPSSIHCNCSGKHLGLIAAIKSRNLLLKDYNIAEHPIYDYVEEVLSDFCMISRESIVKGIDGCGIPVYGVPLKNMALAYANLANVNFMGSKYKKSQEQLLSAMVNHPEMIGGSGRADTYLLGEFGDRLICKTGAEASFCSGLLGKEVGFAFKIEDGTPRAVGPVAAEVLIQLGVITRQEALKVKDVWNPPILNNINEKVGEIKPVFTLVQ